MLKTKGSRKWFGVLALCAVFCVCAARPEGVPGVPPSGGDVTGKPAAEGTPQQTGTQSEKQQTETQPGMTINNDKSSKTLYTEALELAGSGMGTQKYATVKRGDFITTATASGTVIYPKQETIRYDFPYGNVYFLEDVGWDSPVKAEGEVIARIYVEIDEIELAARERQLQRMEERGETGETYEELKKELAEMQEAVEQTEIIMEKDGLLLEQDVWRYGTQISSYSIVVADLGEQLIEVPNENKLFRYGQEVKVTAKINGETREGTGTVITASANALSEDLAGDTAYIRLSEDSRELYAGSMISVTVETVHMENVLLLDTAATYIEDGNQMVKIKDEYGLHSVGFSAGRKGTSAYWIVDGLEEGAQILMQ